PEVVAGNTAYRPDGSIYWQNTNLTDGLNAVGNFDDDPFPEVVLVTQGQVYLLEHDGTVKWGPALLPGDPANNLGGPPTVADVDGDGWPEIGVASSAAYTVFEADGSVKWSAPTDGGAGTSAGTAFDFEGDGLVEIVYTDAYKLRIYRGSDGTVLWETASRSGTTYDDTHQMPVVTDVDADGHAEIVMGSNNLVGTQIDFPGPRGIQVYGDLNDRWAPTRPIWNQHTYHVTNVEDDGTVPQVETDNWQLYNNYRVNIRTGLLPGISAPDLTASYLRVDVGTYPAAVSFTGRIGNGGAAEVPAGLRVAFYACPEPCRMDGDPSAGGTRLGSTTTSRALAPGEYEDMTFTWTAPGSGLQTVYVVADDDDAYTECNEANNVHWYQYITGAEGPDLVVPLVDASGTTTDPQTLTIQGTATAQIANQGSTAVSSQTRLPKSQRLRKSPESTGDFDVTFFEDLDGDGAYTSGTDNTLGQATHTGGLTPGATINVTASISGSVRFVGSPLWAFADSSDAVPELDESNNLNQTATQCQVNAAPAPDLTLSHLMAEPADLSTGAGVQGSKGAEEQRSRGAEGQGSRGVDLTVRVANAGEAPVPPGVSVNFYLGDPAAGGTLLGNTATSRTLAPGEYEDVSVRWADETAGTHSIYVTVDATNECEETNNDYQQRVDILDIPLVQSWNLISGWVNPFTTDITVVQRPISGTYTVIQGFDGGALVYYPDLPAAVNTLKTIDAEHGYWIKTMNAEGGTRNDEFSIPHSSFSIQNVATLRLVGSAFPENRELALDAGWDLVSFLSRNEMGVMEGLRSIDGEYTAVLGFDQGALSYYPHLEPHFNTLWALRPLYGYWLKLTQESTLR
ncbi:MAG: CARDB domain-containing protein, partial [Anaerolineae bacterium]